MRPRGKDKEKQCAYCERTFIKEEHLRRHERAHTGEKPFKCHKCHRRYGRSDVLARHLQTHPLEEVVEVSRLNTPPNNEISLVGVTTHTGQRILESTANRPDQRNPLLSSQPLYSFLDCEQSFATCTEAPTTSINPSVTLGQVNLDNNECSRPGSSAPTEHRTRAAEPDLSGAIYSTGSNPQSNTTSQDSVGHGGAGHMVRPMPPVEQEAPITGETLTPNEGAAAVASSLPNAQTTESQPLFWQIMRDQGVMGPENAAGFEADQFLFDIDFGAHYEMSPGILDYLDFPNPASVHPLPSIADDTLGKTDVLFSVDQLQRMRKLWRGRRTAPAGRIIRSLWHSVVQHPTDNIFSQPQGFNCPISLPEPEASSRASRWGFNGACRSLVVNFCKELDEKIPALDSDDLTPGSTTETSSGEEVSSLPNSPIDGFPTTEVLGASLDLFFHCSHLPFLHKATFDAQKTPRSLLLPMCLIGLSSLYPDRSKSFVLHYQAKLMRFGRSDLTSKALGHCQTWELLVAIASTLLVVYLALGYLDDLDEYQAHMLSAQMLHIVEKHGLFAPADGDDLVSELQAGPSDREGSWKAWSRVESIKRMISCLLWMDMAYTRLMGSAGVVDMDKAELHLACDVSLFDAPTSSRFLHAAQRGAQLVGPRMQIQGFHINPPPRLDHMSMETVLVALYLQTAALRHRLPVANHKSLDTHDIFSKSSKAKDMIKSILLLPSNYPDLFRQRHRVTAFAWNNVCIALIADLNLLELASGREGIEPARTAMLATAKWAETPSARRAILHAAQVFDILSSSRFSESNIARPDLLLFNSALVLSMYFFACNQDKDGRDFPAFELFQDVDWTSVVAEGMRASTQPVPSRPHSSSQYLDEPVESAKDFIRRGGPVSFAGELMQGGGVTAKKILLHSVRLLDDLGKWRTSRYSQLLRTMSDFVIEGNN